ncbi:MAG: hypothetical protein AB7N80_10725 [Bdellovibrionales bacterium]
MKTVIALLITSFFGFAANAGRPPECQSAGTLPLRVETAGFGVQTFQLRGELIQVMCRGEGGTGEDLRQMVRIQLQSKPEFQQINEQLPPATPVAIAFVNQSGDPQAISTVARDGQIIIENTQRLVSAEQRKLSLHMSQLAGFSGFHVLVELPQK